MPNPLEKYKYKFEKDSWKPASIEEIEIFESEHSLILPPELKLYYQLYNGAFLRHCYYPNIILRSAIDPEGLDKGGGITIDKLYPFSPPVCLS